MTGVAAAAPGAASRMVLRVYMTIFFIYMFFPLFIMVAAGFNDFAQPSVTVWRGFTFKWFGLLAQDERMWTGLANSVIIAVVVIIVALPQGLAGAFLITRLQSRFTGLIYAIMVSPLLTPGIILGISTLIFWRNLGVAGGLFTAILAQSTFIASYAMLMFMARLQRQDLSLEEAALDLGATHSQAFWRITVPFLKPTIVTASVIAFLQSFENYNTTIFAIGGEHTLVTEIGSRMRFGLSPTINVIGILFIVLTVIFATLYVLVRERERRREAAK
ncbi:MULTISPECIES: ABC transporter permease [Limibacillus]|jgi:spermidine/putrescine transport system permease protein|uniref:Spermidine/putrescine transport system permease protein n=1 Tax=Limibacillus halophilus TaxID=1579333 RepID=A0A839SZ46_9PROT|nr:ABC transporter permease [Limibacillus halophilus]MBB3066193.1 spermidine/putrescine transport system permease protein [Limibacillus halophilus]